MTYVLKNAAGRWPLIALFSILLTGIALATAPSTHSSSTKATYLSQVTMAETRQSVAAAGSGSATASPAAQAATVSRLNLYLSLAASPATARAAATELKLKAASSPTALAALVQNVDFSSNAGSDHITVKAKAKAATKSSALAVAFANALISGALAQQKATKAGAIVQAEHELASIQNSVRSIDAKARATTTTTTTGHNKSQSTSKTPAPPSTLGRPTTGDPVLNAQLDALIGQYSRVYSQLIADQDAAPAKSPLQIVGIRHPVLTKGSSTASRPIRRRYWVAGGLGAGLLLGVLLALALALLDRSVRDADTVEKVAGLPVIAEIPRWGRHDRRRGPLLLLGAPLSSAAEAYRRVRSAVERLPANVASVVGPDDQAGWSNGRHVSTASRRRDGKVQVVGLVGARPGSGCTTTATNLALTAREAGFSPILIDANLRRPALHRLLSTERAPGLADGAPATARPTIVDGVSLVPAGTQVDNPTICVRDISVSVAASRLSADIVIVDLGDLTTTVDAVDLADEVDALLIVLARPRTTLPSLRRTTTQLTRIGAPIVGLVLVELPRPRMTKRLGRATAGRGPGGPSASRWRRKAALDRADNPATPRSASPGMTDAPLGGELGRPGGSAAPELSGRPPVVHADD